MHALEKYGLIPIDYATLRNLFQHYKSPKDKIASLEKKGDIKRIKRGLYIVSPTLTNKPISRELIANHLYGPSYVSNEWALFYYGIIPERVQMLTSMTMKRSKQFSTELGYFGYTHVPSDYFGIGLNQEIFQQEFSFLMAGPEKALCDMIYTTNRLRLQSVKAVKTYLEENLRCDFSGIKFFDLKIVEKCFNAGVARVELENLLKYMEIWNKLYIF